MSRVGKQPIKIAAGVKVVMASGSLKVEGPKGKLSYAVPKGLEIKIDKDVLTVARKGTHKRVPALHGTARTLIANLVRGAAEGFKRELDIQGVGYRAAVSGNTLSLTLGFSHPVDYKLPQGVTAKVEKNTHLVLEGADKVLLGETAAKIRSFRPPEPYQGKGIRYTDERIIRKQGKAAGAK